MDRGLLLENKVRLNHFLNDSPGFNAILIPSEYVCHVHVRSDNLAGVVISDHEYPGRVAFTLLNKVGRTMTMQTKYFLFLNVTLVVVVVKSMTFDFCDLLLPPINLKYFVLLSSFYV